MTAKTLLKRIVVDIWICNLLIWFFHFFPNSQFACNFSIGETLQIHIIQMQHASMQQAVLFCRSRNLLCQVTCFIYPFILIILELAANDVTIIATTSFSVNFKYQRNFVAKDLMLRFSGRRNLQWDRCETCNAKCSCKYVVANW